MITPRSFAPPTRSSMLVCAASLALCSGLAHAQVRSVTRVAEVGQSLASSGLPNSNQNISTINNMISTNTNGEVGFIGVLEDGTNFVWNGSNAVFTTPMGLPRVLGSFEGSAMGIGPSGKFVISANIDGGDGIWTQSGRLIAAGDPAPGLPGKFIGNASRPLMSGDGTVSWIGALRNSATGANTNERAMFVSLDGTLATTTARYVTNQVFDGVALNVVPTQGLFFDHQISDGGRSINRMRVALDGNVASNNVEVVVVHFSTGPAVLIESGTSLLVADQAGGGTFFVPSPGITASAFPAISINDSAVTLIGAVGASSTHALVKDSVVVAQTGSTIAGVPLFALATTDRLQAVGVTPFGAGVVMWRYFDLNTNTSKTSFFASQVGDFSDAEVVLTEGDQIDWTGDGAADGVIVSLPNPLHRCLDVPNDGTMGVFARVSDVGGANERDMVLRISLGFETGPSCDSLDFNQDGLFPDDNDLVDFLSVLAGGPCSNDPNCNDIDFNNDELFPDDSDLIAFLRVLAGGECTE